MPRRFPKRGVGTAQKTRVSASRRALSHSSEWARKGQEKGTAWQVAVDQVREELSKVVKVPSETGNPEAL